MRRCGRVALPVLLLALAAPAPAGAQVSFVGTRPLSAVESPVKVTGQVRVDFHGEGVSGTVTWRPGRTGALVAFGSRRHGEHFENGFLSLGDELGYGEAGGTSARVRREGGGMCADIGPSLATVESGEHPGSGLSLRLFGLSEVVRTRCAGPLGSDVADLLPTRTIDEKAMLRGGAKLDFSADGEFSAQGLAGTLHSDVVLKVRRGASLLDDNDDGEPPFQTRPRRVRYLQVDYKVERTSGQVVTSVHGLDDPDLCGPLDACGLAGTVTAAPRASSGDGFMIAFGPAKKHSWRELERSLGLSPGPVPRGVHRAGYLEWTDEGSVTSDLSRAGAPACQDSAPIVDDGLIEIGFRRESAAVKTLYYGSSALRTRCPGPDPADAGVLARGQIALRKLAAPRATLHLLRGGGGFSANGYRGSSSAGLEVTVRRTRIRHRVEVELVPDSR